MLSTEGCEAVSRCDRSVTGVAMSRPPDRSRTISIVAIAFVALVAGARPSDRAA
jgi:hypothetical protein